MGLLVTIKDIFYLHIKRVRIVFVYFSDCLFRLYFPVVLRYIRSSYKRCFVKKCVVKNFTNFTGKNLCQDLFFNKVAGLSLQLCEK